MVVIESRNRVGGKILSVPNTHNTDFIDLGSQWISPHHKNTLALLKELKIQIHSSLLTLVTFIVARSRGRAAAMSLNSESTDNFQILV